jgi:hypothetical protein
VDGIAHETGCPRCGAAFVVTLDDDDALDYLRCPGCARRPPLLAIRALARLILCTAGASLFVAIAMAGEPSWPLIGLSIGSFAALAIGHEVQMLLASGRAHVIGGRLPRAIANSGSRARR